MIIDVDILIYGAIFIGMLLLIEGAYYMLRDWRRAPSLAINRRMRMLGGSDRRTVLRRLRREDQTFLSRFLADAIPFGDRLLVQAGATATSSQLASAMAGLALVTFVILHPLQHVPLFPSVLVSAALGIALPLGVLLLMRRKRLKRFGEQLPDAIDLLVRSLRAGHPVSAAMGLVAEEMPDPMGTEFGVAVDEMTYGLSMNQTLDNMARRVPHADLAFFVVAVQIQHATGGNLAEILGNLSTVIRDRFRMFAKIRAVSAEGRLSAVVISLIPFLLAGAIMLIDPRFFGAVASDAMFLPLIGLAAAFWVVGAITVFKMVHFRV
jgi:tight adherence protein B